MIVGFFQITTEAVQNFIKAFPSGDNVRFVFNIYMNWKLEEYPLFHKTIQIVQKPQITIVVGGTAADSSSLSVRGSRVVVDLSDYSSLVHLPSEDSSVLKMGQYLISCCWYFFNENCESTNTSLLLLLFWDQFFYPHLSETC